MGIKSSRYFSGILRCRKDSRDQAFVNGGGSLGKDILIIGNENRNRAGKRKIPAKEKKQINNMQKKKAAKIFTVTKKTMLLLVHGDVVVVDLLSENNWTTPSNEIAFNSSNAEDGKKEELWYLCLYHNAYITNFFTT